MHAGSTCQCSTKVPAFEGLNVLKKLVPAAPEVTALAASITEGLESLRRCKFQLSGEVTGSPSTVCDDPEFAAAMEASGDFGGGADGFTAPPTFFRLDSLLDQFSLVASESVKQPTTDGAQEGGHATAPGTRHQTNVGKQQL
jgi:hypothetical protein